MAKTVFAYLFVAFLLLAMAWSMAPAARSAEYLDGPHWAVVIDACDATHCERFRKPFDADNEVSCAMRGWAAATSWLIEHPGWRLKSETCAPANEKDA